MVFSLLRKRMERSGRDLSTNVRRENGRDVLITLSHFVGVAVL